MCNDCFRMIGSSVVMLVKCHDYVYTHNFLGYFSDVTVSGIAVSRLHAVSR